MVKEASVKFRPSAIPSSLPVLAALVLASAAHGATVPADPLAELNQAFHAAYASARAAALERQGPVVVVSGDELLLYRNHAQVARAVVRPARYHLLKVACHVPLAILLEGPGSLDPARRAFLEEIRRNLGSAKAGLERADAGEARRQEPLLGASIRMLDAALAKGAIGPEDLDAFAKAVREPVEANLREAAGIELACLDRVVGVWKAQLRPGEWEALRVLVIGSHMAREGEVSWQYFARLLGEDREGDRLVFAEEKWDPEAAMALLASHRVDRGLGAVLFGDPWRLHRDVMADAAKKWLDTHPAGR